MSDVTAMPTENTAEQTSEANENTANTPNTHTGNAEGGGNVTVATDHGPVAGERLKSFIDRVERLEEEKKVLMEDIKEVYAEAKAVGFDVKIMRKVISVRKMEDHKRREEEELLDLYLDAIGMR